MDALTTLSLILLPVTVGAATAEGLVTTFWLRRLYDWRAFWASFGVMLGRRAVELLPLGLFLPLYAWVYQHRLFPLALAGVAPALLLFLGVEFFYYWSHRASHRMRWFWATHAVHHSPNERMR